jgi:hypothetical protein
MGPAMSIRNNKLWLLKGLLFGLCTAFLSQTAAQTARPATEAEARAYIFGAFLTQAASAIMSERVTLGPELEERLSLPSGADGRKVYEGLVGLTDNKRLQVRKATAEERAGYAAAKDLKEPLYTLEADDIKLLMQYDLAANNIPFVGQLGAVVEKPPTPLTSVQRGANEPPPAPPIPAAAPAPPPIAVAPLVAPPAPVVVKKPKAPVAAVQPRVVPKPPPPAELPPKGPRVIAVEPTPAPAPQSLRRNGPCLVKPVMTDQDLVNCGASPR